MTECLECGEMFWSSVMVGAMLGYVSVLAIALFGWLIGEKP